MDNVLVVKLAHIWGKISRDAHLCSNLFYKVKIGARKKIPQSQMYVYNIIFYQTEQNQMLVEAPDFRICLVLEKAPQ
jgi:hypothetical protein